MEDLVIKSSHEDGYPRLVVSSNEDGTVELSVVACQWSGYGKSLNEQQADEIIAHLQKVFKKRDVPVELSSKSLTGVAEENVNKYK